MSSLRCCSKRLSAAGSTVPSSSQDTELAVRLKHKSKIFSRDSIGATTVKLASLSKSAGKEVKLDLYMLRNQAVSTEVTASAFLHLRLVDEKQRAEAELRFAGTSIGDLGTMDLTILQAATPTAAEVDKKKDLFQSLAILFEKRKGLQGTPGQVDRGELDYLGVVFSPNGRRIASTSDGATICVWDTESGKLVASPFEGHTDSVRCSAFLSDRKHIASGSGDQNICIWDVEYGEVSNALVADPFHDKP